MADLDGMARRLVIGRLMRAMEAVEGTAREMIAADIWRQLSPDERETLHCLVAQGPVWDGDVPSKTGRTSLIAYGLASKALVRGEHGYQVANYVGATVFREGTRNQ